VDIYVLSSKKIRDTSLVVTAGGAAVAMAVSDSANNVYRGSYVIGAAGTLAMTACARDLADLQACEDRSMDIALIRALEGGVVASAGGDLSMRVLPGALKEDLFLLLDREMPPFIGGGSAWGGAQLVATYDVGPEGVSLGQPGDLRVKAGPPGATDLRLGLADCEGGAWRALPTYADTRSGELVASVGRLGRFALVRSEGTALSEVLPVTAVLKGNRPNPFNPRTTIQYVLPDRGPVRLRIYEVTGRLLRTLVAGDQGPGSHDVVWDGRDDRGLEAPSGMYVYRHEAAGTSRMRKMVLLK
jgi:hypothetical protein